MEQPAVEPDTLQMSASQRFFEAVRFYASDHQQSWWEAVCFEIVRPSMCCPSLNTYFTCCNISSLTGRILVKFGTNIHNVSGHFWKGFQGQRSKFKSCSDDHGNLVNSIACELLKRLEPIFTQYLLHLGDELVRSWSLWDQRLQWYVYKCVNVVMVEEYIMMVCCQD